jgi:hypothetical protein
MSHIRDEWKAVEKIVAASTRAEDGARGDNDPVKVELARELKAAAGRRARASSCTSWEHL